VFPTKPKIGKLPVIRSMSNFQELFVRKLDKKLGRMEGKKTDRLWGYVSTSGLK